MADKFGAVILNQLEYIPHSHLERSYLPPSLWKTLVYPTPHELTNTYRG